MELIEEIKKKNGGETDAKNWSHEDIERLLELTDRGKQLEELDRERDGVLEEQSASYEEFSESEAEPTVEETEEPDEVQAKDAEEAEIVIEGQTGQSVDGEIDDDEFEAKSLENAVKFLSGEMKTEKEENINFGKNLAKHANYVIVVNKTNKEAIKEGLLLEGFNEENIFFAQTLIEARIMLKEKTQKGDVVLFENDLPDNYI